LPKAALLSARIRLQPLLSWRILERTGCFRLSAGSHVIGEIHYQHGNDRVVDRGKLGLFFDARRASTTSDLLLEAKLDAKARLHAEATLTADTMVLALRPEMPAGIRSLEVRARRGDGRTDVLLFAKDFSPKWPTPYILAEPVRLPRGTTLSATAYGDNADRPVSMRIVVSTSHPTT